MSEGGGGVFGSKVNMAAVEDHMRCSLWWITSRSSLFQIITAERRQPAALHILTLRRAFNCAERAGLLVLAREVVSPLSSPPRISLFAVS